MPPPRSGLRRRLSPLLVVVGLAVAPLRAVAHDPSAYGGLFRSRDDGATWLPANPGRIVTGAVTLAVSPADPTHLLLGTDSGLLGSRNGGLDWIVEAPTVLIGAVFAVAFDADGKRMLAATGTALFRSEDGQRWQTAPVPAEALPPRALAPGPGGRVYLAGWRGLYRSDDWGASWAEASSGLADGPTSALAVSRNVPDTVYAVTDGHVFASVDGARTWRRQGTGLPEGRVEALGVNPGSPGRLWAVGGGQVFRSDDGGGCWLPLGRPLPVPATLTRGIAAGRGSAVTLTTDRGVYRSPNAAANWDLVADNLPAHLEAWPLARDPVDPATLYAGFALTPYAELWRLAAERGTTLGRLSRTTLAGGAAFLALLGLAGGLVLRKLARYTGRPGVPRRAREPRP